MSLSDWVMIGAMLLAPAVAVQVDKFLEKRNEKKAKRMQIFSTLMSTRATPISPNHVEALNRIDIEFYDNKRVKEAWKLLLDHFGSYPSPDVDGYQIMLNTCAEEARRLLIDLLYEMAKSLGYDFDKVHLKRSIYIPKGHTEFEFEQETIRKALLKIMTGQNSLPVKFTNFPGDENQGTGTAGQLPQ